MKKLLSALLFSIAVITPAAALNIHFQELTKDQNWLVFGSTENEIRPKSFCLAGKTYEDGSSFELVKDMTTLELYIYVRNVQWNLTPGDSKAMLVFMQEDGSSVNHPYNINILSPTDVTIEAIPDAVFVPLFVSSTDLIIVPETGDKSASISLTSGAEAATLMKTCINSLDNQYTPPKPIKPMVMA
jgi:hypothetical protein